MTDDIETAIELIQSGELIELAHATSNEHHLDFNTPWSSLFDY